MLLATRATIQVISYAAFVGNNRTATAAVGSRLRLANVAKIAMSPNFGDILDILVMNSENCNNGISDD